MINRVGTVYIFVQDQDRAKAFYTEKLGMELRVDVPMGQDSGSRWLSVLPPGGQTDIVLRNFGEDWEHYREALGKSQALTLECDDIDETYQVYKARGVQFLGEPKSEFWGRFVVMVDSEGNRITLLQ